MNENLTLSNRVPGAVFHFIHFKRALVASSLCPVDAHWTDLQPEPAWPVTGHGPLLLLVSNFIVSPGLVVHLRCWSDRSAATRSHAPWILDSMPAQKVFDVPATFYPFRRRLAGCRRPTSSSAEEETCTSSLTATSNLQIRCRRGTRNRNRDGEFGRLSKLPPT